MQISLFDCLSEWTEKTFDKRKWGEILTECVSSQFVRDGISKDIDVRVIEPTLLLHGCGAYFRKGDKFYYGKALTNGEPNPYYIGRDVTVTCGGGMVETFKDWETNPDVVVCWNTPNRNRDNLIYYMSDVLSEIDTSLRCNVFYSRLYPIAVAPDEKTRLALEQIFKNVDEGKLKTIVSSNILENITGQKDMAQVLNVTDVTASDKIQYLAKYRDDVLRWFWSFYGQNVQATSKLAQESVSEVTSGEGVSMILPHAMLHERQREMEQLKSKFGWDCSVKFSEPWQNSFADCNSENDNEEVEENEQVTDSNEISGTVDQSEEQ